MLVAAVNLPLTLHGIAGDYRSIKDIIHLCKAHLRAGDVSSTSSTSGQHLSGISSSISSKGMLDIDMDEIHLSLSRPFVLRLHQIEPFVRELSMALGLIHQ